MEKSKNATEMLGWGQAECPGEVVRLVEKVTGMTQSSSLRQREQKLRIP